MYFCGIGDAATRDVFRRLGTQALMTSVRVTLPTSHSMPSSKDFLDKVRGHPVKAPRRTLAGNRPGRPTLLTRPLPTLCTPEQGIDTFQEKVLKEGAQDNEVRTAAQAPLCAHSRNEVASPRQTH